MTKLSKRGNVGQKQYAGRLGEIISEISQKNENKLNEAIRYLKDVLEVLSDLKKSGVEVAMTFTVNENGNPDCQGELTCCNIFRTPDSDERHRYDFSFNFGGDIRIVGQAEQSSHHCHDDGDEPEWRPSDVLKPAELANRIWKNEVDLAVKKSIVSPTFTL